MTVTPLTPHEQATLLRIAEGYYQAEIAQERHVTESAVSQTAAAIRDKLCVPTTAAAVYTACRMGLLPLDGPGHREDLPTDPATADDEWHYALGAGEGRTYPRSQP